MYSSERIDDQINKETAQELGIDINIIDIVSRFQFRTANEATQIATSIELTDLGVFKATKSKLTRKIATLEKKLRLKESIAASPSLTDKKKETADKICDSVRTNIEFLSIKRRSYED